jgi:hypothetical protein
MKISGRAYPYAGYALYLLKKGAESRLCDDTNSGRFSASD